MADSPQDTSPEVVKANVDLLAAQAEHWRAQAASLRAPLGRSPALWTVIGSVVVAGAGYVATFRSEAYRDLLKLREEQAELSRKELEKTKPELEERKKELKEAEAQIKAIEETAKNAETEREAAVRAVRTAESEKNTLATSISELRSQQENNLADFTRRLNTSTQLVEEAESRFKSLYGRIRTIVFTQATVNI